MMMVVLLGYEEIEDCEESEDCEKKDKNVLKSRRFLTFLSIFRRPSVTVELSLVYFCQGVPVCFRVLNSMLFHEGIDEVTDLHLFGTNGMQFPEQLNVQAGFDAVV